MSRGHPGNKSRTITGEIRTPQSCSRHRLLQSVLYGEPRTNLNAKKCMVLASCKVLSLNSTVHDIKARPSYIFSKCTSLRFSRQKMGEQTCRYTSIQLLSYFFCMRSHAYACCTTWFEQRLRHDSSPSHRRGGHPDPHPTMRGACVGTLPPPPAHIRGSCGGDAPPPPQDLGVGVGICTLFGCGCVPTPTPRSRGRGYRGAEAPTHGYIRMEATRDGQTIGRIWGPALPVQFWSSPKKT